MEVDEDLEAGLLRQFNCMLTTDKEVLIKELQTLVGAHLNEHTARFYLEMNDWLVFPPILKLTRSSFP